MKEDKYLEKTSFLGGNRKGGIIDYDYYEVKKLPSTDTWHETWQFKLLNATSFNEAKQRVEKNILIARARHGSKAISKVYINSKWRDISILKL